MSKGIVETLGGFALVTVGVIGPIFLPFLAPFSEYIIGAGAGMVLSGVGTMLSKGPIQGFATTTRNPTAPRNLQYGRSRVGGTTVYLGEFGASNKYLDMVTVLADHHSLSIDELLFDNKRIQIGAFNTSLASPVLQQTLNISSTAYIVRVNNVVTVTLSANIPLLVDGDQVFVQGVAPTNTLLNGKFQVTIISRSGSPGPGALIFSYLAGGPPTSGAGSVAVTASGQVMTAWADYGSNVYVETMTGGQTLGSTFEGMLAGTPYNGQGLSIVQNENNPWTADCSLLGCTAVMLRLQYDQNAFASGLPQISFHIHGKCDILDPRIGTNGTYAVSGATWSGAGGGEIVFTIGTHAIVLGNLISVAGATPVGWDAGNAINTGALYSGPVQVVGVSGTTVTVPGANPGSAFTGPATLTVFVYTENAALCIADYLSNTRYGFKAKYGTEIPWAPLIAAANICDEAVTLEAGGTEPRYTLNGGFPVTMKRAEVLKNMLTSCAGRLTYEGGQFIIWPGAWTGVTGTITGKSIYSLATGAFRWKPKVSISNLYNGVKGTYISPVNNWQSSDFPYYAQDGRHGYNATPPGAGGQFDVNLYDDGLDRRWLDIQLPFTISCPTAQRLAKIELMRRRQQGTGTFAISMAGYQFAAMDVVAMDLPYFAWTAKNLEIQAVRLKIEKQGDATGAVLMGVEIDVQETDSSVYDWSVGEELSPAGYQQSIVPDTMTPAPPTDVLLSSGDDSILVTWTAPADGYVLQGGHIEVEYQLVESPEGLWHSLAKMDPTVTSATITGLIDDKTYNVQVRSVNAAGVASAWVVGSPSSGGAPGPVTIFACLPWSPGWTPVVPGDALYPAPASYPAQFGSFGVQQIYKADAGGNMNAYVACKGAVPPSNLSQTVDPPVISCVVGTSGSIPAGIYTIGVSAYDSAGANTPYSNLLTVAIPTSSPVSDTGSMVFTITWATGSVGGVLEVACPAPANGFHFQQTIATAVTTATLTAIDLSTSGGPDANFNGFEIQPWFLRHAGSWAEQVDVVTATTLQFVGATFTVNQYAGSIISYLAAGNLALDVQILNLAITSNTADTLTIGVNSAGVMPPDLTTLINLGTNYFDLMVMRFNATFSPNGFSDGNIVSYFEPFGFATSPSPGAEKGSFAVVLTGQDAGDWQPIASNTSTDVTLAGFWNIQPAPGDLVVIVSSDVIPSTFSQAFSLPNIGSFNGVVGTPNVQNLGNAFLLQVFAETAADGHGPLSTVPFREIGMFGAQGTRTVTASDSQLPTDRTLTFDTSGITTTSDTIGATAVLIGDTTITLTSGLATVSGTYITIDPTGTKETMFIVSGGGTATLTVTRGMLGTSAAPHASGVAVTVAGALLFQLLSLSSIGNQSLFLQKISTDINYVLIEAFAGASGPPVIPADTFDSNGSTSLILADSSAALGTQFLQAPGN